MKKRKKHNVVTSYVICNQYDDVIAKCDFDTLLFWDGVNWVHLNEEPTRFKNAKLAKDAMNYYKSAHGFENANIRQLVSWFGDDGVETLQLRCNACQGALDAYYKSIRMELDRTGALNVGEFIC